MIESEFVQVAVEAPINKLLDYKLPQEFHSIAHLGSRVIVPLGRRKSKGVIVDTSSTTSFSADKIKSISEVTSEQPIDEKNRKWLQWLTRYYFHPPGQVFSLAFSPRPNAKGKSRKSNLTSAPETLEKEHSPNSDQAAAIKAISEKVQQKTFAPFLLYGITGSGKTEVYLQSIKQALSQGQQVLVLVPEISLTPQLIKRFTARFGDQVAVIHSHLTSREKAGQWWEALDLKKQILIGARSALFCPLENIGLIIVDEEHETSFKQDEHLKYNARDAAIVKAQVFNCPIVLGSATPSLETWHNARTGKFSLLELKGRVESRELPEVEIIDMRTAKSDNPQVPRWMSDALFEKLSDVLKSGDQAVLFLNRRGFGQYLFCTACGFTDHCPNCSVSLTVHDWGNKLTCHYCGFSKPTPQVCPSCKLFQMSPFGLGTEKIADELKTIFPKARIARADRDEINSRESLEGLLSKIQNKEVDFVVGTQMVAKGHDFPDITLVGVVSADVGLNIPDFRAAEKTFQLLTQVAGRAGRHKKAGQVVIQTYMPENPVLQYSLKHDFVGFANYELENRKNFNFPPFGRLAIVRLQGPDKKLVEEQSQIIKSMLSHIPGQIEVLGPIEAPLAKLKNKFRYQILLKSNSIRDLSSMLKYLTSDKVELPSMVRMSVDMDPMQSL